MEVDGKRVLGAVGALSQINTASHAVREASGSSKAGGKMSRKVPSELSLTLVHGDAVILEGDDFEVSNHGMVFYATADEYVSAK